MWRKLSPHCRSLVIKKALTTTNSDLLWGCKLTALASIVWVTSQSNTSPNKPYILNQQEGRTSQYITETVPGKSRHESTRASVYIPVLRKAVDVLHPLPSKKTATRVKGHKKHLSGDNTEYFVKYLIIGNGVAGQAAQKAILETDPGAQILVLDPPAKQAYYDEEENGSSNKQQAPPDKGGGGTAATAGGMHGVGSGGSSSWWRGGGGGGRGAARPPAVEVWRGPGAAAAAVDAGHRRVELADGRTVHFEKALVAAGGARPALPPGFAAAGAEAKVSLGAPQDGNLGVPGALVASGGHVTVVGGDWSAFYLAAQLNECARRKGYKYAVTLLHPGASPLAAALPAHLASALARRLRARGMGALPYTLVRYVDKDAQLIEIKNLEEEEQQEEDKETESLLVEEEQLGLSPTTKNNKNGSHDCEEEQTSAVRDDESKTDGGLTPHDDTEASSAMFRTEETLKVYICRTYDTLETGTFSTDHLIISSLDPEAVMLSHGIKYSEGIEYDYGFKALKVNAELMASSSVYAAGESALLPQNLIFINGVHRGIEHAYRTGTIAGRNMAGRNEVLQDVPKFEGSLDSFGARVVALGNCDARLETHGFWWRSGGQAKAGALEGLYGDGFRPLYGLGVVLFLRGGRVCGVLLWGLPSAAAAGGGAPGPISSGQLLASEAANRAERLILEDAKGLGSAASINGLATRLERVEQLAFMARQIVAGTALENHRPLHRYAQASGKMNKQRRNSQASGKHGVDPLSSSSAKQHPDYQPLFQHARTNMDHDALWARHHRRTQGQQGSWFEQTHHD